LDVASEEFQLLDNVGKRRINVLLFRGYEFRRDRDSERHKTTQRWVCRWARKFDCKSKLKLTVQDIQDIRVNATINLIREHNHDTHRPESYGVADFTEIHEQSTTASEHYETGLSDISRDFNRQALEARARSSPIATSSGRRPEAGKDLHTDLTDSLVETSQKDVRGYPIHAFRQRLKEPGPADHREMDVSSVLSEDDSSGGYEAIDPGN